MNQQSFFEFLSLSHQERIHSQIISWIFSLNFNGANEKQKLKLLHSIFKLKAKKIKFSITEYENIDILIKTDSSIIIIENKFKSSQHSNQLEKYLKICKKEFPNLDQKFYFLTLIGENSRNENWSNLSYEDLYTSLRTLKYLDHTHSIIFKEYLVFLKKLVDIFSDFKENHFNYPTVFLDGKKKKIDKIYCKYPSANEEFIGKNQLETIFQKCFLNRISNYFEKEMCSVSDTRGDALIDIIFETVKIKNRNYNIFLQLQLDNIKFAIADNNYDKSKKASIEPIIEIFESLKKGNTAGYNKLNRPKNRAYISLSKKMIPKKYWEMKFEELTKVLSIEIEHSKKMAKQLKAALEKL